MIMVAIRAEGSGAKRYELEAFDRGGKFCLQNFS